MNSNEILAFLSIKYKGDRGEMYECIKNKQKIDHSSSEMREALDNLKEKYVTLLDEEYPSIIKKTGGCNFPIVLFYRGDLSLCDESKKRLCVIGSRENTKYGEVSTQKIVSELPNDVIIVSGLARGIDSIALQAAIDSGKKTIAILGSGIDVCYPKENERLYNKIIETGGLILSEYPPKVQPDPNNFRWRNRILAMIADGVLVGEAKEISGTKITVGFALRFNKSVGCIPYPISSQSFCNTLIKEGALLVETGQDALDLL